LLVFLLVGVHLGAEVDMKILAAGQLQATLSVSTNYT